MIAIEKCKIGAKVAPKWGFRSRFLSIFLWYRHHVWSMIVGAFSSRGYPISPQSVSFDQLCIVRVQTISEPVMELSFQKYLNTSYLTDSNIVFTHKLESRQNFCSDGWIRSSTYDKKIFPIFLHAGSWLFLLLNLWFSLKLVSKIN